MCCAVRRLVVEAKRRRSLADGYGRQGQQQAMPRIDADDGDCKFVIFIKTKNVSCCTVEASKKQ